MAYGAPSAARVAGCAEVDVDAVKFWVAGFTPFMLRGQRGFCVDNAWERTVKVVEAEHV